MAGYDWNGNGKDDLLDSYVEYNMVTGEEETSSSMGSSSNKSGKFYIFLIILGIISTILRIFK